METRTITEQPLLCVEKPYEGDDLKIYAADLKAAEVGTKWKTENQDRYPNSTCVWVESFTVVYKDGDGVAVLYRCEEACGLDYYHAEETELIWVELEGGDTDER